jgi:hypothetical protein
MDPPPPMLALDLRHGAWCVILKMTGWTCFEQALVTYDSAAGSDIEWIDG